MHLGEAPVGLRILPEGRGITHLDAANVGNTTLG
jgi:hypothetical protein